jgi:DNA-binding LytR/AlgR family response regulator
MKIAIVDDEDIYVKRMISVLRKHHFFDYKVFTDGESLLASQEIFDLVLLDIEMPGDDGIAIAKRLKYTHSTIVFMTNYEQRMREAFGTNVDGFLLKDHLEEELSHYLSQMEKSLEIHHQRILLSEILWIHYENRDLTLHLKNGADLLFKEVILKDVKQHLDDSFFQINRTTIISLKEVTCFKDGQVEINHSRFTVSRRAQKKLKICLMERNLHHGYF